MNCRLKCQIERKGAGCTGQPRLRSGCSYVRMRRENVWKHSDKFSFEMGLNHVEILDQSHQNTLYVH